MVSLHPPFGTYAVGSSGTQAPLSIFSFTCMEFIECNGKEITVVSQVSNKRSLCGKM